MSNREGGMSDFEIKDPKLFELRLKIRRDLLARLEQMDWESRDTLPSVMQQFFIAQFKPKELATVLLTSPASISRWSRGERLPPYAITREGIIRRLHNHLRESIQPHPANVVEPDRPDLLENYCNGPYPTPEG